jgi:hypothetical protein
MSTEREQFEVWAAAVRSLRPVLMKDCHTLDDLEAFLRRAAVAAADVPPDAREPFEALASARGYRVQRTGVDAYDSVATQVLWDFWRAALWSNHG